MAVGTFKETQRLRSFLNFLAKNNRGSAELKDNGP